MDAIGQAGATASGSRDAVVIMDPTNPMGQLNREWLRWRDEPRVLSRTRSWAEEEPVLLGLRTPVAIEAAVHGSHVDVDGVLHTLLRHAQEKAAVDCYVASRIVLQVMLPRAVRLARCDVGRWHGMGWGRADRQALAVSCLYEAIRGYPLHRRARVAANLAMETFAALHREVRREALSAFPLTDDAVVPFSEEDANPGEELVSLLRWAVDEGVLCRADVALLGRRYLAGGDTSRATWRGMADAVELGQELGVGPAAIRQRCCRAVRVLRQALAAESAQP